MDNHIDPIVIDPEGPDIQGEIARIRERGPVTKVVLPGGVPAWSVTDAAVLKEILSGSEVSKDPRQHWPAFRNGEIGKDFPLLNWVNTRSMFTAYGSEHRRLRTFVAPAFTNRRTAAMEPRIQAIADDLVTGLDAATKGDVVDLRESFAYPLPLRVINELMGVPEHLIGPLRKCVDGIFDIASSEAAAVANCPGAPLARLEAQVALPTLFQRFPHMKLAVSPDELGTVPGFIANGHDHLPVLLK